MCLVWDSDHAGLFVAQTFSCFSCLTLLLWSSVNNQVDPVPLSPPLFSIDLFTAAGSDVEFTAIRNSSSANREHLGSHFNASQRGLPHACFTPANNIEAGRGISAWPLGFGSGSCELSSPGCWCLSICRIVTVSFAFTRRQRRP